MHKKILYCCDTCNFMSDDPKETDRHEAAHVGLTPELLKEYRQLQFNVRHASCVIYITKNEGTETSQERAIRELLTFEREHGVTMDADGKIRKT